MKVSLLSSLLLLNLFQSNGQPLPAFAPLRYNEDYSFLKTDSLTSLYAKIKYQPLGAQAYVSWGGEARYQYFGIRHEGWQQVPADHYFLSRFLLHSDFHASERWRLFVQGQSSLTYSKASGASPVDENHLDLHQAFLDVNSSGKKALLRIGRQEFLYGSQRLLSVREGPNNRQAFDAIKGIVVTEGTQLDVFYGRYVSARKGIFDDVSNKAIKLWGGYLVTQHLAFNSNIDLYYIGLQKDATTFADGTGREMRHSLGGRFWGRHQQLSFDGEGVYQWGRFDRKNISAWTLSINTSLAFLHFRLRPVLGLKTEIISGDRRQGDHRLQTFNPLFPRGAYFGLAALIGPLNIIDIHPSLALELKKDLLVWTIDYDAFWRHQKNDGIYAPNVSLLLPSAGSDHYFIGHQLASDIAYTPNRFLSLQLEATWFYPGPYLKSVGATHAIIFWGVTSQLKF